MRSYSCEFQYGLAQDSVLGTELSNSSDKETLLDAETKFLAYLIDDVNRVSSVAGSPIPPSKGLYSPLLSIYSPTSYLWLTPG